MPKVWIADGLNGVEYANRKSDVIRLEKDGEFEIDRIDAAAECNRLARQVHDLNNEVVHLVAVISDFVGMHPSCRESREGRALVDLLRTRNPSVLDSCGILEPAE